MSTDMPDLPPGLSFSIETEVRAADSRFLEDGLIDFNVRATGIGNASELGLFLRQGEGAPVAGLYGWSWGGTCHVRYLFVREDWRRHGLGRLLMQRAEAEARRRGCRQMLLETYDFQAPGFYQKQGFQVASHIADYPAGHKFLVLLKRLE